MTKEQCIDLPGEKVQCWMNDGVGKLKVVLRKHRDVIFDFNNGSGASYTLEATESDFYNVRDKKLVLAKQRGQVTFRDGERMHVWVSRGFRGALVVRSQGSVISRVIPSELDDQQYGADPKQKPAPVIIAIGSYKPNPAIAKSTSSENGYLVSLARDPSLPTTLPVTLPELSYPVVCVVDGTAKGMPDQIMEYFQTGGDHSGFADIDPNQVATRNWIWGQAVGTGAYVKDNWEWLRASIDGKTSKGFQLVKAKVHYVRGKVRFYFSGYSNSNTVFGRGGFGPGSDRIVSIFAGVGSTESAFAATVKGVAGTFKGNALISFIFGSATAIAEWRADTQKDGYDLAAMLIMSTTKAIIGVILVSIAVAVTLFLVMMIGEAGVSVLVVGAATIFASLVVGYSVESIDKTAGRAITHNLSNTDGMASVIAPKMRDAAKLVEKNWEYLMGKMSGDYREIRFDNAM